MTAVRETSASTPERLEVDMIVDADPTSVWHALTDANGLASWWADEAEVDASVGGSIEARWPSMGWIMRGTYRAVDPGRMVEFTWSWDHEPEIPVRVVQIELSPVDSSTHLVLRHGEYGPGDAAERAAHLAGWEHFLPRLASSVTEA